MIKYFKNVLCSSSVKCVASVRYIDTTETAVLGQKPGQNGDEYKISSSLNDRDISAVSLNLEHR
jgi:hypothetical protein